MCPLHPQKNSFPSGYQSRSGILSLIPSSSNFLDSFVAWAESQPLVRAAILTSTRAVPNSSPDVFSDYDIILALTDVRPFFEDRAWLEAFGPVLALYQDPLDLEDGLPTSGNVVQFATGLKIDFSLSQVGILQRIVAAPQLPPEFDAGYQVLLDKDHLTAGLKPPTYRAYIPTSPTHAEYDKTVECFFLETTYVAKLLWRDDIIAAKHIADTFLKLEDLIPMLVWRMEMDHNWSYKPGPYGRGLKKWLRPDLWAELESTYAGASIDENWDALWRAIDLMRKVAREVGSLLGYPYPQEIDDRTLSYLRSVKNMLPSATTFPPEILNTPH